MLAVGRDGPNVNKKLMKLLTKKYNTKEAEKELHLLLDYGSCVLHTGHNSVKEGLKANPIKVSELAKCVHGFFKYSTLRRADFAKELIDLELAETVFIRHVDTRWLTLQPALERIDKNYEAITHYFLVTLPSQTTEGDVNERQNAKNAMKAKYYQLVKEKLEKPDCLYMIRSTIFMCQKFSPFMHKLQSAGPQIPDLYMDSTNLLLSVLSCFLKPKALPVGSRQTD